MRNGLNLLTLVIACASLPLRNAGAEPAQLLKLRAVPFTQVQIHDSFWAPRQETNRVATIPINFAMLEKAGNIRNFELAAARATNRRRPATRPGWRFASAPHKPAAIVRNRRWVRMS